MKRAALTGLAWLLLAGSARAEPPAVSVALDYRAPASCPDAAAFRAHVASRTPRVSFVAEGKPSELQWRVTLARTPSGVRGRLRVTSAQRGHLERQVEAADCAGVESALSLVAALSVDPEASLTPVKESAPKVSSPTVERPAPPASSPAPVPPPPPSARRLRLSLGLALAGRTGVASQIAWAARPFVGFSLRSRGGYTWGLGLSATQARGSAALANGQADLTWSLARLEAFPVRASFGALRLEPTLFFEAGQLRARGVGISPSTEVRRPALFTGALARVSLLAFDLLLLQLEAGPLVAIERDRFYLYENSTVFHVPLLSGVMAVGVGLEFL